METPRGEADVMCLQEASAPHLQMRKKHSKHAVKTHQKRQDVGET